MKAHGWIAIFLAGVTVPFVCASVSGKPPLHSLQLPWSPAAWAAEAARVPPAAAVIAARDIETAIGHLSPRFTDDEPLRVLQAGPDRLGVFVVRRPNRTGPQRVQPDGSVLVTEGLQLEQVSAVLRVLEGSGILVTGGTLVAPQRMTADDPDSEVIGPGARGKAILQGHSQRVSTGDVIILPAGVPHGFSEIEAPITYLVMRVDSGHSLPLR